MGLRGRTSTFLIRITDDDNDNLSSYATKGGSIIDVDPTATTLLPTGKRQQEIEEEWNTADRASRMTYTQTEESYYLENDQSRHWKSKKRRSNDEDDLSQPWLCEETDPFTARI
ncbi:hypothetical protein Tco_0489400 [Tanacetum coccineum]